MTQTEREKILKEKETVERWIEETNPKMAILRIQIADYAEKINSLKSINDEPQRKLLLEKQVTLFRELHGLFVTMSKAKVLLKEYYPKKT